MPSGSQQPSVTVNGIKFCYAEIRKSGSVRHIQMWRNGVAQDRHEYSITPNPHDDAQYEGHEPQFYLGAANIIAHDFISNNGWSQQIQGPVFNTQYTFDLWGHD